MLSECLVDAKMKAMFKYRLVNGDWNLCRAALDALINGLYSDEVYNARIPVYAAPEPL